MSQYYTEKQLNTILEKGNLGDPAVDFNKLMSALEERHDITLRVIQGLIEKLEEPCAPDTGLLEKLEACQRNNEKAEEKIHELIRENEDDRLANDELQAENQRLYNELTGRLRVI